MNSDHVDCIRAALVAQHSLNDPDVKMEKIVVDGYFAVSGEELYF